MPFYVVLIMFMMKQEEIWLKINGCRLNPKVNDYSKQNTWKWLGQRERRIKFMKVMRSKKEK